MGQSKQIVERGHFARNCDEDGMASPGAWMRDGLLGQVLRTLRVHSCVLPGMQTR